MKKHDDFYLQYETCHIPMEIALFTRSTTCIRHSSTWSVTRPPSVSSIAKLSSPLEFSVSLNLKQGVRYLLNADQILVSLSVRELWLEWAGGDGDVGLAAILPKLPTRLTDLCIRGGHWSSAKLTEQDGTALVKITVTKLDLYNVVLRKFCRQITKMLSEKICQF